MRKRTGIIKICPICEKPFYVYPHLVNERKYCSHPCKGIRMKQAHYNMHLRKGEYKICSFCGQPYYCHKYRLEKSLFCSQRCLAKSRTGKKAPNWRNGIYPEILRLRKSEEYKIWREAVFARDNYTCQKCHKRGVILHAHHIKHFSKFPELRFDITNGITLCKKCHDTIYEKA